MYIHIHEHLSYVYISTYISISVSMYTLQTSPTKTVLPCKWDQTIHQCYRIHIYIVMGWLRLVDFLKLWVSFAKEPYKRNDILQKRPIVLRSLLIVATPSLIYIYTRTHTHTCISYISLIYIYIYTHAHTHLCLYVCACACVCIYI